MQHENFQNHLAIYARMRYDADRTFCYLKIGYIIILVEGEFFYEWLYFQNAPAIRKQDVNL